MFCKNVIRSQTNAIIDYSRQAYYLQNDHHSVQIIDNGAIFQRDGRIVDIGFYNDIVARHRADTIIGFSHQIVLPGSVNSHHHIGLTPLQLGSLNFPLEQWFATRLACRIWDSSQ